MRLVDEHSIRNQLRRAIDCIEQDSSVEDQNIVGLILLRVFGQNTNTRYAQQCSK